VFSTVVAFIVFALLGNMLITNGRTGDVEKENIDSAVAYIGFEDSEQYPLDPVINYTYIVETTEEVMIEGVLTEISIYTEVSVDEIDSYSERGEVNQRLIVDYQVPDELLVNPILDVKISYTLMWV